MLRRWSVVFLLAVTLVSGLSSPASARGRRVVTINVADATATGDKIRGPVVLRLERVNRLRYDVHTGSTVTFTAGPSLPLMPALPTVKAAAAAPAAAAVESRGVNGGKVKKPATDPFSSAFGDFLEALAGLEVRRSTEIETVVAWAAGIAQTARDDVDAVVRASSGVLQTGGPEAVLAQVKTLLPSVQKAREAAWPTAEVLSFRGDVEGLEGGLLALPHLPANGEMTWTQWYQGANKAGYDAALVRVDELRDYTEAVGPGSKPAEAFRILHAALAEWHEILLGVQAGGPGSFTITLDEQCHFGFDKTRSTKVELVTVDRLAAPGTGVNRNEIVTVECTTPLSVSGGIAFSFVDEIEFGFVQSTKPGTDADGNPTTTIIKEFAEVKKSKFRTPPLLLVNTRFLEWNDTLALHASAGAVVDLKGDPGTELEFVAGPSLSINRSLFITLALHAARVPKLAGGFAPGDEVPAGVAAPPLEKELKAGFLISLTYRLKP